MGIEKLTRLLTEAAEHVPPPQLAEAAWAQAAQVRRRRRLVGSSAAAVCCWARDRSLSRCSPALTPMMRRRR